MFGILVKMSLAHYILLPLLCLFQLALHSAQESTYDRICRNYSLFQCGRLGYISYPFFRVEDPKCGVIAMNCSAHEPEAQFQENGKWYTVNYINPSTRRIQIRDQDVQRLLESQRCELLKNFTEQAHLQRFNEHDAPYFISFNIRDTHPFFKCKCKPDFPSKFVNQFHNQSCNNYELYYMNQGQSLPTLPESSYNCCSVVQLPSAGVSDDELEAVNDNDNDKLTSLWKADFTIEWKILSACTICVEKGGLCQNAPNKSFKCSNFDKSRKKGVNIRKKVVVGVMLAIGVVILGITVLLLYHKLRKPWKLVFSRETASTRKFEEFVKRQASYSPKRYNFKEIIKMTQSFSINLGHGGYGSVFKGALSDGKLVAVKVLEDIKGNGEDFINEVESICRTSHVNIVSLLGFCFDGSKRALIYEFMPNGSLEKYIYDKGSSVEYSNLGWAKLHEISVGVARGLEYLHLGCNTRILHLDIKPQNILLDQDFFPKISDFGLAKLCPRKDSIISLLGARGTVGYIAPEVFSRNFGHVSHKSDVYSYGMMIIEMVGGRTNIDVGVNDSSEIYFPDWIYKRIELNEDLGLQGVSEAHEEIPRKMILVGLWCIQTNPLDRPTMSRVLEMLEGSLAALEIPPRPFFSSPPRVEGDSYIT